MWTPLVVGAKLVIARPGGHVDPEYIAVLLDKEKVTFFNTGEGSIIAKLRRPCDLWHPVSIYAASIL